MLFKKKEYICVPLTAMHVYGEKSHDIISNVSYNNAILSDDTEIKLFFEYTPNHLKELITGTRYERSYGFKFTPGSIYSEDTKTSCIDYNNTQFTPVSPTFVKQYMKELKEKKLYKEYIERIKQFYYTANLINNQQQEINGYTK